MYRYPLETVVQTSFGIMNDRPMVLVKLVDEDGWLVLEKSGVIFLQWAQSIVPVNR